MNTRAKKIKEELGWQIAYARERREKASPDGRAAHQVIPSDLVEAVAVVMEAEIRTRRTNYGG